MQQDDEWKIIASNQANIIEDLSHLCWELIDRLKAYQNTEAISDELEEMLGRRVKL